jgi:hypothetical protein
MKRHTVIPNCGLPLCGAVVRPDDDEIEGDPDDLNLLRFAMSIGCNLGGVHRR